MYRIATRLLCIGIAAALMSACTEHRYTIAVHNDNGTLHRDVTLEHAQHALERDDPELLRLVRLYGAGEAARGGGSAAGDSARQFHGTFERAVPNDFGNAGVCVRCSSPVGQTIVYCEQFRAVADAPDLLRRSEAALDALLDALCIVIEDQMPEARDRPAQRSLIQFLRGPFREDIRHLQVCGWALALGESIRRDHPSDDAPSTQVRPLHEVHAWFLNELLQRRYLVAEDLPDMLHDSESSRFTELSRLTQCIALRLRTDGLQAAASLLERFVAALPTDDGQADSDADTAAVHEEQIEFMRQRCNEALRRQWSQFAPSGLPFPEPLDDDADSADEALRIALTLAFPAGVLPQPADELTVELRVPGMAAWTNSDTVPQDGALRWKRGSVAHPDRPMDIGARTIAVVANPDADEQNRLWGATRLTGRPLSRFCGAYVQLSARERTWADELLAAAGDAARWEAALARRDADLAASPMLARCVASLVDAGLPAR